MLRLRDTQIIIPSVKALKHRRGDKFYGVWGAEGGRAEVWTYSGDVSTGTCPHAATGGQKNEGSQLDGMLDSV